MCVCIHCYLFITYYNNYNKNIILINVFNTNMYTCTNEKQIFSTGSTSRSFYALFNYPVRIDNDGHVVILCICIIVIHQWVLIYTLHRICRVRWYQWTSENKATRARTLYRRCKRRGGGQTVLLYLYFFHRLPNDLNALSNLMYDVNVSCTDRHA